MVHNSDNEYEIEKELSYIMGCIVQLRISLKEGKANFFGKEQFQ